MSKERYIQTDHPGLLCKNLAVGYGKKVVVDQVELCVEAGRILTLIGPNGSGKSTILKTITRQLAPMGGCIHLSGRDMREMPGAEIAKSLSMVMTERPQAELMTCREVAATGRYPYVGMLGILSREDWAKVDEAMALVRADEVADQSFAQISDGQRQRVMLARALCQEPQVLVLDEPTSYLDMRYKLDILGSLRKLALEKQLAVIMSLHELELAMKVADQVACVSRGAIKAVGSPEEIFTGTTIQDLYQVDAYAFSPLTGAVHMRAQTKNKPEVFVIGGGGSGIMVYNRLQRQGIPFAAGILMENDMETETARAGACELVVSKAFHPMTQEQVAMAKALLDQCSSCICGLREFGPLNEANRILMEYAREQGKLRQAGEEQE